MKKSQDEQHQKAVNTILDGLTEIQQEVVRHFINFSNKKSHLRRYTVEWILECLLLRIKSKALYEHMRNSGILPLPSSQTLDKYIGNIDRTFGFQDAVFDSLKIRASRLEPQEKRGKKISIMQFCL